MKLLPTPMQHKYEAHKWHVQNGQIVKGLDELVSSPTLAGRAWEWGYPMSYIKQYWLLLWPTELLTSLDNIAEVPDRQSLNGQIAYLLTSFCLPSTRIARWVATECSCYWAWQIWSVLCMQKLWNAWAMLDLYDMLECKLCCNIVLLLDMADMDCLLAMWKDVEWADVLSAMLI